MEVNYDIKEQDGDIILTTDCYDPELMKMLEQYADYDIDHENWKIKASHQTTVNGILTDFSKIMCNHLPNDDIIQPELSRMSACAEFFSFIHEQTPYLYKHQREVLPLMCGNDGFLLADDMGLGKSIITLASVLYNINERKFNKVLIFCQKRAIQQWINYSNEFTPDIDIIGIEGTSLKRKELWASDHDVKITNLEKILWDFEYVAQTNWDMIVIDEASYFIKNPESKRSKKIFKLKSDNKLALTGTAIENNLVDLYSIFNFIKPGLLGNYAEFERDYIIYIMKSIPVFRRIHGKLVKRDNQFKKIVGYKNLESLKKKIAPYYRRRTEHDIDDIELPSMVTENFIIPMHKEQMKIYKDLKEKAIKSEYQSLDSIRVKLLRSCDHSGMIDPSTNYSNKIETLLELLHENRHRKVIVFSQWADMIVHIHKALEGFSHAVVVGTGSKKKFDFKINDQEEFEKFKTSANVLIATDAISRSQDFPYASVVINVDLPVNPATLDQRRKRVRRLSSKFKTVFNFNLVSKDSVEEKILPILEAKIKLHKDVIEDNEFVNDVFQFDFMKLLQEV